ncbi:MAG: hypothetical protein KA821_04945 [Chitinophagaceae bacterium]|nr:hypothetical protein [Chitinophagaceae bacterium]
MSTSIRLIRRWLLFFVISLLVSGLTVLPLQAELDMLARSFSPDSILGQWFSEVRDAWRQTNGRYSFLAYGYDWLAFGHLVIALLFIGVYRDPVRNRWIIEWAMICCLLIIPVALLSGYVRNIPFWWRLVDCSFGILGLIPLSICHSRICELEEAEKKNTLNLNEHTYDFR